MLSRNVTVKIIYTLLNAKTLSPHYFLVSEIGLEVSVPAAGILLPLTSEEIDSYNLR